MPDPDDIALLRQFARDGSEAAFATLVSRYVNLVYSAALQRTGNPHHAEEISQAVFIILARKAANLSERVVLSGWLYHTTQLTAGNFIRTEIRRARREQEAHMQSILEDSGTETWAHVSPILHEAMSRLKAADRDAIVLRYFENKSVAEMAAALRIREAAAHKRLTRAVERLRGVFVKRGVKISATALVTLVAANSVHAAPTGLATSITAVTAHGAAVTGSTAVLVKGALKLMAWTKAKLAIVTGVGLLVATAVTPLAVHYYHYHLEPDAWRNRFEAAYRLSDGEMIKHIVPPYMEERDEYYHKEPSLREQATAIKRAPDYFVFHDNGKKLVEWGYAFGGGHSTLGQVLRHIFQFRSYELEGADTVLNTRVDGDWVIRGELSVPQDAEASLKQMAGIVTRESKRTIHIEKQTIERDVIVASGSISLPSGGGMPNIAISLASQKTRYNGGVDTLSRVLTEAGDRLHTPVIDETSDSQLPVAWGIYDDAFNIKPTGPRYSEQVEKLLANLRNQTGLTFRHETRPVQVWVVSAK